MYWSHTITFVIYSEHLFDNILLGALVWLNTEKIPWYFKKYHYLAGNQTPDFHLFTDQVILAHLERMKTCRTEWIMLCQWSLRKYSKYSILHAVSYRQDAFQWNLKGELATWYVGQDHFSQWTCFTLLP
jgi:hypothetical protein